MGFEKGMIIKAARNDYGIIYSKNNKNKKWGSGVLLTRTTPTFTKWFDCNYWSCVGKCHLLLNVNQGWPDL